VNLAYILNTYPQPSQSFIRREIVALEAMGHIVHRIAMRPTTEPLVDPLNKSEADKAEYVLKDGTGQLAKAAFRRLRADPRRFLEAMKAAFRMGRQSDVGVLRHMIYLAEAAHIAERCAALGVTHAHAHFGTNPAAVAMLSHLLGGPRYSFTVHGPEEFDAPRALSLRDKIHHAAFAVAISQFGRSQLCRWADHADWPRIKVVHCGIEPIRYPAPVPLPVGPRRIVAIGRLVEQKGQLALIDAMAGLADTRLHLTLIGDGEMRPQIEAAIAHHGIGDHVTLTGWVDEDRVNAELAASHALIMPSFAEGLPMVVMEAMATGRPVIATHIAGTPELVIPGLTGWLVAAGDVDALRAALLQLHDAPLGTLDRMGRAGRARALVRHDVTAEAATLAGFIAQAQKP
jgi:glycosyltransferase involved in cell wall biosynthesis